MKGSIVTDSEDEKTGGFHYSGEHVGIAASDGGQGGKGEAEGKQPPEDRDSREAEDASPAIADSERAKDKEREMEQSGEELAG